MIHTRQKWPSVFKNCNNLVINNDGSVEVFFGPEAPYGKMNNWIKTVPGNYWHMVLRIHNPCESWFNNVWEPGKIEQILLTTDN
jgi:hypothetical protein